jgi:hypothetical protein
LGDAMVFGKECFTSTRVNHILRVTKPNTKRATIICPNSRSQIGVWGLRFNSQFAIPNWGMGSAFNSHFPSRRTGRLGSRPARLSLCNKISFCHLGAVTSLGMIKAFDAKGPHAGKSSVKYNDDPNWWTHSLLREGNGKDKLWVLLPLLSRDSA